jgi:hypothetical protein
MDVLDLVQVDAWDAQTLVEEIVKDALVLAL